MTEKTISEKEEKSIEDFCLSLYILYIFGILSQMFTMTLLPGVALLSVTYIFSILKKCSKNVKDTIYESHIRWMLRTLYIGAGIYLPIAILISGILIFALTDTYSLGEAFFSGDENALLSAIDKYLIKEGLRLNVITYVTMGSVILWFINRYYIGIKKILAKEPINKVKSWL